MITVQCALGCNFLIRKSGSMICFWKKILYLSDVQLLVNLILHKAVTYHSKQGLLTIILLFSSSDFINSFRILGGVTKSPRPEIYCKEYISDLSVCDTEQKEMAIDETYCLSVDHLGRPVDIYSRYN